MAQKMKENFQKNASVTKPPGSIPTNVYINRAGRPVPLTVLTSNLTTKDSHDKSNDSEDSESVKGKQLGNIFLIIEWIF